MTGLVTQNGTLAEAYTYDAYGKVNVWGYPPMDFNRDGDVDNDDLAEFTSADASPDPAVAPKADADGDGDVDGADYTYFQAVATSPGVEPATLFTSGVGNQYFFTGWRLHFHETRHDGSPEDVESNWQVQYNRARHYTPTHGRWLQRDPLGVQGWFEFLSDGAPLWIGVPTGGYSEANLYRYGKSNPVVYSDWNGHRSANEEQSRASACYKALRAVAAGGGLAGRDCTAAIVWHFLFGQGRDLPCPSKCQNEFEDVVKDQAWGKAVSLARKAKPCTNGSKPLNWSGEWPVTNLRGHPDWATAVNKFTLSKLTISGHTRCCNITEAINNFANRTHKCCTCLSGTANATMADEEIDYDTGAAGGGVAGYFNDCAALLERRGSASAFTLKGCKATVGFRGALCGGRQFRAGRDQFLTH